MKLISNENLIHLIVCGSESSPTPPTYTYTHLHSPIRNVKVTLFRQCWLHYQPGVNVLSGDHAYRVSRFGQALLLLRSTFWSVWSMCTQNTWTASSPDSPCLCSSQDYWLSLLYKRLIGPKVLAVHVAGLQRKPRPGRVIRDKLRIYAHCTSHHK